MKTIVYTDITFEDGRIARVTTVLSDELLTVNVRGLRHVTKVKVEKDQIG